MEDCRRVHLYITSFAWTLHSCLVRGKVRFAFFLQVSGIYFRIFKINGWLNPPLRNPRIQRADCAEFTNLWDALFFEETPFSSINLSLKNRMHLICMRLELLFSVCTTDRKSFYSFSYHLQFKWLYKNEKNIQIT